MSDLSEHDSEQWAARSHVDAEDAIAAYLASPETEKRLAAALRTYLGDAGIGAERWRDVLPSRVRMVLAALRRASNELRQGF